MHLSAAQRLLVERALACYRSDAPVSADQRPTHGHDWDHQALFSFRDYIAHQLSN